MDAIVYFAHPICHYDKMIEMECIDIILNMLLPTECEDTGIIEIMNPNQKWLSNLYMNRKNNDYDDPFYIFKEIAEACDVCVGVTFLDGYLGAGVASEMQHCLDVGKPVYLIFFADDVKLFLPVTSLDNYKILTIEETRERIKEKVI